VPHALDGLRVIDAATLLAGPVVESLMADFGADVIKIEHPRGDPDELDAVLEQWIGARTADEAIAALREAEAAAGPVYSIADIVEDPHDELGLDPTR